SNQQHPTHTFVNAGEFTVTLTVQNLDGSDSYSTTISVYAFPEINLGDDIESCTGNTVVLDAGDNYASYLWTGGIETQS
ncbi:MAG TPA: PKD domain-containing protein, partial [Bacteroidales bacterium]|nr:PKD domain-containing protein [Bacteroidales bacterium]